MRNNQSEEDYLERILMLTERNGSVRSIDLAKDMGFSKPSISIAMKKLEEKDYIIVENNGNLLLTEKGLEIAKHTYEKHKILTDFFKSIGVSDETASEDACKIEHDLSEESFDRLKEFLRNK